MNNKHITKKLNHYKAKEHRRWKQLWNTVALLVLVASCITIAGAVLYYGNGQSIQPTFLVFIALLAFSISALLPSMYLPQSNLNRWQISSIKLGALSATGIAALCALFILELQSIKAIPL